ncbi:MAG: DUF1989 domain-containing protein [Alphaproteobacteria bacterium]|nr:MAG: DUF1989 domain-containing protein [Alphaproteobacteria bacterium]
MSRTPDQIAADRARYEEHQKKGLEFAPRALPEPSPLPPMPIDASRILHTETIPGGWYWWTSLKKGEALRVAQPHGFATVALVAWSAKEPSERLNLPDTVKVQWNTRVQKGRVPAPVVITRYQAEVAADDLCRTATAEAIRGFENNAFAGV